MNELTLETVCNGALPVMFKREIEKVLKNIKEIKSEKARGIKINITFAPSYREGTNCVTEIDVNVAVTSSFVSVPARKKKYNITENTDGTFGFYTDALSGQIGFNFAEEDKAAAYEGTNSPDNVYKDMTDTAAAAVKDAEKRAAERAKEKCIDFAVHTVPEKEKTAADVLKGGSKDTFARAL